MATAATLTTGVGGNITVPTTTEIHPPLAKRPVMKLAGPYGHPIHPAMVTLPIGAWAGSLLLDLGSHIVKDGHYLVQSSMWLMAFGVLTALLAALFGFIDLLGIPSGTRAQVVALVHMCLNLLVVAAYIINFFLRDPGDARVDPGNVIASAVTYAFLCISGFLGGHLVFRYGVRVVDELTQSTGFSRHRQAPGLAQLGGVA